MKQENFKKIMEQSRSKKKGNNEAKESVEEETMATMNMRSTTQEGGGLEKALNSNITTLNTYWYQFSPYPLNLMGTGGAVVGYLASTNYYYLAEFTMSLETAQSEWNLTKERLTSGYLVFTPTLLGPGYAQFDITTKSNQLLSSWNSIDGWSGAGTGGTSNNKTIVLPISSIYDEESDTVCFKLWPYSHSSSIAGFSIEDMKFAIPTLENINYGQTNNSKQTMDIHIPKNTDGTYKAGPFPAVITIHGGNWKVGPVNACDKQYYDYMTDFITNTCNCVHVNMNYRLLGNGGGLDTGESAKVPYKQMLDDIGSVIAYLQAHADIYHVDSSKIALMGYSAGGHLALLYAYSTANNYTNQAENPIKLVISEAGPTHFVNTNNNIEVNNGDIFSMTGIAWDANGVYSNEDKRLLKQASPYWIVEGTSNKSIFPYTILAYGNGVTTLGQAGAGDGLILYSQATLLESILNPTSSQVGVGTGDNASQIIEGENCILFKLFGVGHGEFGEGAKVCPNVVIEENDDTEVQALKTLIQDYYNTISNTLQELAQQED